MSTEPDLPGFEPAPPAALAHVSVLGRLVNSADVYTPDSRSVCIELLIRQADPAHPHAANILVRCTLPAEHLAELQHQAREHYPAGAEVIVSGTGIEAYHSRRHGAVLRLLRVNHYARIAHEKPTPTPGAQPHAQQPAPAPTRSAHGVDDAVVF